MRRWQDRMLLALLGLLAAVAFVLGVAVGRRAALPERARADRAEAVIAKAEAAAARAESDLASARARLAVRDTVVRVRTVRVDRAVAGIRDVAGDSAAVVVAADSLASLLVLERAGRDAARALCDSIRATEPSRIAAAVALAVVTEQRRAEAAEADARRAHRRVWRARTETLLVGVVTFLVGRSL